MHCPLMHCHPEEGAFCPTKDLCTTRHRRCCQRSCGRKMRPQDDKTGRRRATDVRRAYHHCALSVSRVKVGCHKKADSSCGKDNAATHVTVPTADNPHPSNQLARLGEAGAIRATRPVLSRKDDGIRPVRGPTISAFCGITTHLAKNARWVTREVCHSSSVTG